MHTEDGSTNGFGALVFPANRQSGARLIWLRLLQRAQVAPPAVLRETSAP